MARVTYIKTFSTFIVWKVSNIIKELGFLGNLLVSMGGIYFGPGPPNTLETKI
jgi:hypothetical protein